MYSEEDLNRAIEAEVLTTDSVQAFRRLISEHRQSPRVDEENFKLFTGFNDIFVVIAAFLMLISLYWITSSINSTLSSIVVVSFTWILSEIFVRKRKMPFPAIMLLLVFSFSLFLGLIEYFQTALVLSEPHASMIASALTALAVFVHWKRFRVPITVAIGMGTFIILILSTLLSISIEFKEYLVFFIFIAGIVSFVLAMYWDASDTQRLTSNADIAFWLHLLSSPLIVHSIFVMLGVFNEEANTVTTFISMIVLYAILSFVSLVIDRRIFMISSIFYVLYAFTSLFGSYGLIDNTFALAGLLLGVYLLLISIFWHQIRAKLVAFLPDKVRSLLP
ncbi:MAG: hypothetical protein Q9M36_01250 [Sulfurovum sp.]|nr:hypothetical protein [Sulfurovum sp.]